MDPNILWIMVGVKSDRMESEIDRHISKQNITAANWCSYTASSIKRTF